jgi:anthranilate 1,2-dioxygenase small subunit
VCTTRENEEQGLPVAMMLDDSRARIADRVKYVTRVWAGTFEEYRTRHFVQRLHCAGKGPSLYEVESQFMVAYTTARGQSELLVVGVYLDEVIVAGGRAKFRARKAVLDTVVIPRYLVYPI